MINGRVKIAGKPVSGVNFVFVNRKFRGDRWEANSAEDGSFAIDGREESGILVGFSKDRNFAVARKFETPPPADRLSYNPLLD